jgi:hypothetical protein
MFSAQMLAMVAIGFAMPAIAVADPLDRGAGPRLGVETTAGHVEIGNGHGDGLNAIGVRASVIGRRGLTAQLSVSGVRVDDESGVYGAATIGFRSSGRVWFRAGGGVGLVGYERIDRLQGGTQTGEAREPSDHAVGIAFEAAAGVEVVRRATWQLSAGPSVDLLLSGPVASVVALGLGVGATW